MPVRCCSEVLPVTTHEVRTELPDVQQLLSWWDNVRGPRRQT